MDEPVAEVPDVDQFYVDVDVIGILGVVAGLMKLPSIVGKTG